MNNSEKQHLSEPEFEMRQVKTSGESEASQPNEDSSDSQIAIDLNQNNEDVEYSVSNLESSFDSVSIQDKAMRQNFAQEESLRKKSNHNFMVRLMVVFVILDVAFIAFLVHLALTTDLGFITNISRLN